MSKTLNVEAVLKRAGQLLAVLACTVLGLTVLPGAAHADAGTAQVVGRVVDGTGSPVAAQIYVLVNHDGGLENYGSPVDTVNGGYTVEAPAGEEVAVLAQLANHRSYWLSGGGVSEPNSYLELTAGEVRHVQDITTGGGRIAPRQAPAVRGVTAAGHYLATTRGSWNVAPTAYHYQWLRDGSRIRGANAATYHLTRSDVGRRISVQVVALRTGFTAGSAYSSRLAVRSH